MNPIPNRTVAGTLLVLICGLGLACSSSSSASGTGGTAPAGPGGSAGGTAAGTGGSSVSGSGGGDTGGVSASGGAGAGALPDAGMVADGAADSSPNTGGSSASGGQAGHAVGGSGGAVGGEGGGGGAPAHAGVWRIMPLGDSITGTTCVPQLLSQQLKTAGHTNFVFVGGNLNNQSCGGAPNLQTEGHGGYLVTDLVGNGIHAAELPAWCSADKADVVLMHFGTNDVWNNRSTQSILDAYSTVLADLRDVNPAVIVFVAQIIPLNPIGCTTCEANVQTLNMQIGGWASGKSTAASPVYVVDAHSAFTASTYLPGSMDTLDGVHPNPAGAALIANKWYAALIARGLP